VKFVPSEVFRSAQSEVFCVPQKVVADINNSNNLPKGQTSLCRRHNFTGVANFTFAYGENFTANPTV
jgi:hypothetical protein